MKGDTMVLIEGINVNDLPDDDDFVAGNSDNNSANYIDLASLEGDVAAFMNSPEEVVSTAELKDNKKKTEEKTKPTDPKSMDNVLFGGHGAFRSDNGSTFKAAVTQGVSKALEIEYHLH